MSKDTSINIARNVGHNDSGIGSDYSSLSVLEAVEQQDLSSICRDMVVTVTGQKNKA